MGLELSVRSAQRSLVKTSFSDPEERGRRTFFPARTKLDAIVNVAYLSKICCIDKLIAFKPWFITEKRTVSIIEFSAEQRLSVEQR